MPFRNFGHLGCLLLLFAGATPCFGAKNTGITITGVNKTIAANIRAHLNLNQLRCDVTELQLRNIFSGTDQQMSAALRALGYYNARWNIDRTLKSSGDEQCWEIRISVDRGPATTIDRLDIDITGDGGDDPLLRQNLSNIPLNTGDRLNHGKYEDAKKSIRRAALSLGYFDSNFTEHRLEIDRDSNKAGITLVFDTGPRYSIGEISIDETPLDRSFIERYLTLASGDPFDAGKLIKLQNNLINSQYFDQVYVDQSEPDAANQTVDIAVNLSAKSRYESIFGAGYSTDLGPRVNYQLRNRRFNEKGDTYQVSTQFSPVQSHVGVQFQQPGADPINEKTVWALGWQQEDNDTYTTHSYSADVSRIKVFDNNWARTLSLNLLVEDFDVASDSDTVVFLYPGIDLQKSRSNDHKYPTRGWRLSAGARGAVEDVLSDTSFFQVTAGAKFILPLLSGRLIGRTTLGTTIIDDFSKFPASLRFYAGGDNSVRGFDYESLGPKDDQGEVIGGKHLITGSIEYDYRVYRDYSLAVFYDAGNAFDNNEFTLYESMGLGARWHSPIGTIRVDLAFPLEEDSFRFHISMGPEL